MRDIFQKLKIFDIKPEKLRSPDFYADLLRERKEYWEHRKQLIKPDAEKICNLCKSKSAKLFLDYDGYKLFECDDCGCVYANIVINEQYNKIIYDNDTYEEKNKREILATYDYRKNTFGRERLEYLTDKCNFNKNKDNLLDLGCGPGYFLKYLSEKGINCSGLEVTDFFIDICHEKGLNVRKSLLSDEENEKYNIITLFDVLEHLHDPVTFFKTANQKLKQDGYLLAYTPNIHSFAFFFQKDKQNLLLPYEHLSFYDQNSLEYLANICGFEISSIEYYGLDIIDYFTMKAHEDNINYNDKLKDIIPTLQAIIDHSELSNHMRIVFKKIRSL